MGRHARWLTAGLCLALVGKLAVDVGLNRWSRWFFDALERHDGAVAWVAALAFPALVFCIAAVGVGIVLARETLQVRWRQWCTERLLRSWLANSLHRRLRMQPGGMANPEYRISDDVRMATEPLTDFAIGLFSALLTASTFFVILWTVGGGLDVRVGGAAVHVPAFMVVAAIVYGLVVSALIPMIGGALSATVAAKNEMEAHFRGELLALRDRAAGAREDEAGQRLASTYSSLVGSWLRLVGQHARLTWLTNANSAMAPVAPLIFAAPKYLAGELSLGEVMQLASAFAQVQIAIGWLVDNYSRIAEWFASAHRVVELLQDIETAPAAHDDTASAPAALERELIFTGGKTS